MNQNYFDPNPSYSGFDQPSQYPIDQSPPQEISIQDMEDLKQQMRFSEIKIDELKGKFNGMSIEINKKKELRQLEQATNLSTYTTEPSRRFNSFYDDDDEEESTIPLNEIISQIPPYVAITPVLPTMEPEDSLIMGMRILALFLKSNQRRGNFVTFSNPLFDSNDDFTSSDDESLPEEDVPKENFKIYSNPLFEFDDEYISTDPFTSDSIPPGIDDEDFDPEGDILLLENLLNDDPSSPLPSKELNFEELKVIKSEVSTDFEDDISVVSILEGFTDEPSLEENDDLFDLESKENDWKKILYDAPIDDLITEDKVFDPGIHETIFSPTYVRLPFEDRHYLSFTYVIRIFLPYFTYPVVSPFPLSSGSEDIIFDPGISAFHFSLEPVAFKCPMEVCSSTCFVPNITMIWGESS
ncbi:hypothetical protein Tco_0688232 [Tanacetum coccineum]